MKTFKLILSIILFCIASSLIQSFGQTLPTKTGNDTIWSTTFDWEDTTSQRGWTLPEGWTIVDNTEFGYP